ncbi:hypothetical protein GPECTOR_10g808 [Gonium pectorale]|uniref:Mannose-P-dolichol utilization defect 1 protein homolog n=1 Tax=Gonium pectorale TaxID=33097 RepID=A0A150GQQ8_GONPE|nr:hypothetical protein GPECTOR_10g808 [Gonium pectorale]|eukprot:KXZ52179.1 hypothetical protein GPECTOR_10g808 [Gonium pectorale]
MTLRRHVPQIAAIVRAGSAEGLSLTSNAVELLCFTGYAFNTYGEVFACWVQDAVIVGLIFRHMRLSGRVVAAATAAFAAACAWLFSPACPIELLSALQLSTIAVMAVGARLPQIWLNVKRGNAGVLSAATCALNVAGCIVRVYTTVVLTGDAIILGGCITQLLLNAVLLYQSIATPGIPATVAPAAEAAGAAGPAAPSLEAVAATDPPLGGAGPARGTPVAAASQGGPSTGNGAQGAAGEEGGGGAPGQPAMVPAAA